MPIKSHIKKKLDKIIRAKVLAKESCDSLLWEARIKASRLKEKGQISAAENYFNRLIIRATDISKDCFNELLGLMSFFYKESYARQQYQRDSSKGLSKKIDIDKLKIVEDMHKRGIRRFRSLGVKHYELRHLLELVELYLWMDLSEQALSAIEDIFHIKGSKLIPNASTFWYKALLQMERAKSTSQIILLMNMAIELDPSDCLNDTFFRFMVDRIGETGENWVSLMTSINLLQNEDKLGFLSNADFYALNGRAQEKQGNSSQAITFYLKSIENGLRRQSIFKRCLILIEKQHDIDQALRVVDLALKNASNSNYSYSIVEDLLYRKARLLRKSGKVDYIPLIPCYKVKEGNIDIGVIFQEKIRNSLTRLDVIECNYCSITLIGMKEPVISAWDISSGQRTWSTSVPLNLVSKRPTDYLGYGNHGLQANELGIVYWHTAGRVGNGYGSLLFLSTGGKIVSEQNLPDKISEVRLSGDIVVVGCRDGHLRVYNLIGELLWDYAFKQNPSVHPDLRECPYRVLAPQDGSRIACISYNNLYTFDRHGRLLWKWHLPRKVTASIKISVPSAGLNDFENYYSLLDLSPCASLDDIKKAFRKKVFETHPDANPGTPNSTENFRRVYEAYQALIEEINDLEEPEMSLEEDFIELNTSESQINGVFSADGSSITLYSPDGKYWRIDNEGKIFEQGSMGWLFNNFVTRDDGRLLASTDNGHVYFYNKSRLINLLPIQSWIRGHLKDETNELLAIWGGYPSPHLMVFRFDSTLLTDIEMARPIRSAAFLGNSIVVGTSKELLILSVLSLKQVSH